ncbi:MAG: MFS transporter [Eubacteriales bacterium]
MGETKQKLKLPMGFYVCSLGFTFERLAFYVVKYMLAIWIATEVTSSTGGLGLSSVEGAAMSASFVAYTYITPIFGGYIADYWLNPRICVVLGAILMGLGYLCTWQADSLTMVWAMIILVSIGTGLFKGNLSGINGLQFNAEDQDSAFSIQYSFVNIGSFVGTTFLVLLIPSFGFGFVFLVCALFLFWDAIWLFFMGKALGDLGKKPFKKDQRQFANESDSTGSEKLTASDYKKVAAIVLVTIFSVIFWALWYMAYMPAYYHFGYGDGADFLNKANWVIGSFTIPTSYFDSVNALACMTLGPVLAILWKKLAARPQGDMNMFKKTGLGIILLGCSFVVMVIANIVAGDGQCSILWLVLVCLCLSLGEMVFSPLGNSFIVKLAPARLMGLLLGVWPLAVMFANMIWPPVYAALQGMDNFTVAYGGAAAVVIICGIVLIALSGKLGALEDAE